LTAKDKELADKVTTGGKQYYNEIKGPLDTKEEKQNQREANIEREIRDKVDSQATPLKNDWQSKIDRASREERDALNDRNQASSELNRAQSESSSAKSDRDRASSEISNIRREQNNVTSELGKVRNEKNQLKSKESQLQSWESQLKSKESSLR
jgi:chromosome segregation ATPase